jgi:hypothetical protein
MFIWLIPLLLIIFIAWQFYSGKQFKPCKSCKDNEIFYIDVEELKVNEIENLISVLKSDGTRLNPELNFHQAQGKKINIDKVPDTIKKIYLTDRLLSDASNAIGEQVYFAQDDDHYKIFARIYENSEDFLDWHYDNNFTNGNRYTLVIPVLVDECNTSEFAIKNRVDGKVRNVPVPVGKGVLYNGADVYHRITPQTSGCRRVVLIIPLYSDPTKSIIGKMRQKVRGLVYKSLTL